MRKQKCRKPPPELSAPFYMLTFGDMMTLILTFFILLFSLSTLEVIKFQAEIGAIKGALGISQSHSHSPIQKSLPSPSVKQSTRTISRSAVKPTTLQPVAEYHRVDLTEPVQREENDKVKYIKGLVGKGDLQVVETKDEIVLVLPTFGVFEKGSYQINENSPEVKRVVSLYSDLAKQMARLTNYDIWFVGHTDALPLRPSPGSNVSSNMELGFLRAVAMYDFFFKKYLGDKARVTFASQGDNVPIIPDAKLDSELRKNRRVEVHLKKKP